MTGEHVDELMLYEYLDGALDTAATQAVAFHLSFCPSCQAQLAEVQQLFTTLGTLPEAPLTVDLTPRVMAALRPQSKPSLPGWWRWLLVGEGVAAALLLLFLWPTVAALVNEWLLTWPPLTEIVSQQLATWTELQPSLLFPTLPPLILPVPLIIWIAILGLAGLVGAVGNTLLLRPLLRSLSSISLRGQHA